MDMSWRQTYRRQQTAHRRTQQAEQRRREQNGGAGLARDLRWHRPTQEQRTLEERYIALIGGRRPGARVHEDTHGRAAFRGGFLSRHTGLNEGYRDAYIACDPTPFFEYGSGYRAMPVEEAMVVFSLQEAKCRMEFLYQHGIQGCKATEDENTTWMDCEGSPGM